jgi:predicted Kef-type K+ transport protein
LTDAYAINYIIGIGILGIPFAMVQAGILLASSVLLIVVVLSGITAVWIVEVHACLLNPVDFRI